TGLRFHTSISDLMRRRHPPPPLFPYTTLFRSERDAPDAQGRHSLWHFRQLALDPGFAAHNRAAAAGKDMPYWQGRELTRWQQLRDQFEQQARALPRLRAGLNPADTRPATLLTSHFLSNGLLGWLLCALVLLPFAWALEGTLGWRRMLMIWPLSAVLAGALSGVLLRQIGRASCR